MTVITESFIAVKKLFLSLTTCAIDASKSENLIYLSDYYL